MYDILMLSAEKDFNKIKFVYESINKNIENFNKIYCISNIKVKNKDKVSGIEYYTDDEVLNFNFSKFKGKVYNRRGWYIQQYIKLFQNITLPEYLVVDSDIIFNKKIDIFENYKPNFFFGRNQNHKPYFDFMKRILDLDKSYNYSFINEIMFFKRVFILHMLDVLNVNLDEFFNKSVEILNDMNQDAGMSEYELYGNFVTKYIPNSYNYKKINTYLGGKHNVWSDNDIKEYINKYKNTNYDIISMHSWI